MGESHGAAPIIFVMGVEMSSKDSVTNIKIDIASVQGLFTSIDDNDHNCVLSAGDVIHSNNEEHLDRLLTADDVTSLIGLARVLGGCSGRRVEILKDQTSHVNSWYLGISTKSCGIELERLVKIGEYVAHTTGYRDTSDHVVDLTRAQYHMTNSRWSNDEVGNFIGEDIRHLTDYYNAAVDAKNAAAAVLESAWAYVDREKNLYGFAPTSQALYQIENADHRLKQLGECIEEKNELFQSHGHF